MLLSKWSCLKHIDMETFDFVEQILNVVLNQHLFICGHYLDFFLLPFLEEELCFRPRLREVVRELRFRSRLCERLRSLLRLRRFRPRSLLLLRDLRLKITTESDESCHSK